MTDWDKVIRMTSVSTSFILLSTMILVSLLFIFRGPFTSHELGADAVGRTSLLWLFLTLVVCYDLKVFWRKSDWLSRSTEMNPHE